MTSDEPSRLLLAAARLREALARQDPSARIRTALAAGTRPAPEYVEVLVARCAVEPDFFVRDTLTWALTRHPAERTVPALPADAPAAERAPGTRTRAEPCASP